MAVTPFLFADDPARLSIRVVDENDRLIPARAWVDVDGERLFEPSPLGTATPYTRDRSFSFDGAFTMRVSGERAVVHIEKGKEYLPADVTIDISSGEPIEHTVKLERWIDMPSEGWYSADLHVHFGNDDPRVLRQLALADDVHLIPAFTYWLRGRGEEWKADWPEPSYTTPIRIDRSHLVTRNNIEIERINRNSIPGGFIGATFLYNLNAPVTAERYGEHFPTDAALSLEAMRHSPNVVLDSDKPSWAETVIGAALGTLDTIQVCHNHYHRDATLPGGWGMIGPLAAGESNTAIGDGLFHRTNDLYYRFLNCGFRLGVSGGSAIGVMPVAAGQHRVYAKIDGELTAEKYWKAIKEGRSFATSGPMLFLTVDGQSVGSTISRSSKQTVPLQFQAIVRSIEALEALQLIHDGRVIASLKLMGTQPDPVLRETLSHTLLPERSGWVAARALFRAPDGLLRQAHTSPIYLSVDNKSVAHAEDARYMLRWIDVLEEIARAHPDRFPTPAIQEAVLAKYNQARDVYQAIIQIADQN